MESFIDTRSAAPEFRDSPDRAPYPQIYCNGAAANGGFQLNIAYCNDYIAMCNCCQELEWACFEGLRDGSDLYSVQRSIPLPPPALLQRQVAHLDHQCRLEGELHGRGGRLAGADALQEVLDVQVGSIAETLGRFLRNGRLVPGAFQEDPQVFAANVHAGLVAVSLIKKVVAGSVMHGRVVDRKNPNEVFRVFGDGHNRLGLVHARLVRLAGGRVDS